MHQPNPATFTNARPARTRRPVALDANPESASLLPGYGHIQTTTLWPMSNPAVGIMGCLAGIWRACWGPTRQSASLLPGY